MGLIGKTHNDECLIYIFTGKVENVTPIILIKHCTIIGINNQGITFHLYILIQHTGIFILKIKLMGKYPGLVYLIKKQSIHMTYAINVLNMVQIVYLVNWRLRVLMMTGISPKNTINIKSNPSE